MELEDMNSLGLFDILILSVQVGSTLKSCIYFKKAREAQPGRAELWRCLGYKFKSYLEQEFNYKNKKVMMELVDMNSLGLFD